MAARSSSTTNGADEVSTDRLASIALDGAGQAWVVWSGFNFNKIAPVKMRRLTDLDAAGGPTLGPALTVQSAGLGNTAVDLAFHAGRGHIVWLKRTGSTEYSLTTVSFTDLDDPTPALLDRTILYSGSSAQTSATLVSTPAGIRAVARAGKLRLFRYESVFGWSPGSAQTSAPPTARPSAVAFGDDVLAAFQSSFGPSGVKVARFSNNGNSVSTSLETGDGYAQPAIATDGSNAWVVMIRLASGTSVVSRTFEGSTWGANVTQIMRASADDGVFTWPNTLREVDGTLRFVVGQRCTEAQRLQRSAVLSFEQNLLERIGQQFRVASTVNLKHTNKPHRFKGKVSSAGKGCKADRTVRIKKVRPGKSARTVATTTTGNKGGFSAKHTRGGKGRYFAQAGKKVFTQDIDTITCTKAKSAKVRTKK